MNVCFITILFADGYDDAEYLLKKIMIKHF